jgi:hypothetical protein
MWQFCQLWTVFILSMHSENAEMATGWAQELKGPTMRWTLLWFLSQEFMLEAWSQCGNVWE